MEKYTKFTLLLFFVIYTIHMSSYWFTIYHQNDDIQFSMLTQKGDLGFTTDMALYIAQIKDTYRNGNILFQKDPFIKENQQKIFPNGNLIYFLASLPMYLGFDHNSLFFVSSFFAILISILLLRQILKQEYSDEELNTHLPFFVLIVGFFFLVDYGSIPNNFFSLLNEDAPLTRNLGYMGRFPHIQFSIFLLLFWYYRLTRFLNSFQIKDAILLGCSVAVLQYSYFYYWTGAIVFSSFVIILDIIPKYKEIFSKDILIPLISIAVTYIILTIPFWWMFLDFNGQEFAEEFTKRVGKVEGRKPKFLIHSYFAIAVILLTILLNYFSSKNNNNNQFNFRDFLDKSKKIITLGLSIFILKNLQVLIGYTIQPYHWEMTFFFPLFIILFFDFLYKCHNYISLHRQFIKIINTVTIIGIIWVFAGALFTNYVYGKTWSKYLGFTQTEQELVTYIKNNHKDKIFMSNNFNTNSVIAANTNNYLLVGNAFVTHSNNEEIAERIITGFKQLGYDFEGIKKEFKKSSKFFDYITKVRNNNMFKDLSITNIPDNYNGVSYIGHLTYFNKQTNEYSTSKLLSLLEEKYHSDLSNKYDIDFLVIHKPYFLGKIPESKAIFDNQEFAIYPIKS